MSKPVVVIRIIGAIVIVLFVIGAIGCFGWFGWVVAGGVMMDGGRGVVSNGLGKHLPLMHTSPGGQKAFGQAKL